MRGFIVMIDGKVWKTQAVARHDVGLGLSMFEGRIEEGRIWKQE